MLVTAVDVRKFLFGMIVPLNTCYWVINCILQRDFSFFFLLNSTSGLTCSMDKFLYLTWYTLVFVCFWCSFSWPGRHCDRWWDACLAVCSNDCILSKSRSLWKLVVCKVHFLLIFKESVLIATNGPLFV